MIYLILNPDNCHVKIGYSANPEKRLKELQTANSNKLMLLYKCEGSLFDEQHIHLNLKQYCLIGEWYDYKKIRTLLPNYLKGWVGVDIELDFTQVYEPLGRIIAKFDSIAAAKLMFWALTEMNHENMFTFNDRKIDSFNRWLKSSGSKEYNKRSVYIALKDLIEKKVVIKWANGSYQMNPIFMWSDSIEKRIEHLQELKQFEKFELTENCGNQ